ncbi:hypothetical protein [Rhodopirellula sp. MGV]|uniref:hypothetical protein n=1 Tax=Rhodopirellula sp. MGV TaxID=2023130 RepID=UPI001179FA23|nr:hypothetical protein [Rhodopirellula sp. MGV]
MLSRSNRITGLLYHLVIVMVIGCFPVRAVPCGAEAFGAENCQGHHWCDHNQSCEHHGEGRHCDEHSHEAGEGCHGGCPRCSAAPNLAVLPTAFVFERLPTALITPAPGDHASRSAFQIRRERVPLPRGSTSELRPLVLRI